MQKKKKERTIFHKTVNGVILFALGAIFLITLLFGFSQTKTFREYLRESIIENVNSSIDGRLSIENIEGSIFTSLKLINVTLESNYDTVLNTDKIVMHFSPLHLLLKKLYFRKVSVNNLFFNYREIEKGTWNLNSLAKAETNDTVAIGPEVKIAEPEESTFPFTIQINSLSLANLNFSLQSYENLYSKDIYSKADFNNIQVLNLNLEARTFADFSSKDIQFVLNNLSFDSNIKLLDHVHLSGAFHLTDEMTSINKLNLETSHTNLKVDTKIDGLNLFEKVEYENFENYPVELYVKAEPFLFEDMSSLLESTSLLRGKVNFELEAEGNYGDLIITNLIANYENTELIGEGTLKNLQHPDDLFIKFRFNNSRVQYDDIIQLLPDLELPDFEDLELSRFDLSFEGSPLNFSADLDADVSEGSLSLQAELDLASVIPLYNIRFKTDNLNLENIISINSAINSEGRLVGSGFDPSDLNSNLNFIAHKSSINGYDLDSLNLQLTSESKNIELDFSGIINDARSEVAGNLDLQDINSPVYNLTGNVRQLDISKFTDESKDLSFLNFTFTSEGENFSLDDINGDFTLEFDESTYSDKYFDHASVELQLAKNQNHREINLRSNLIDFNIEGEFSLEDAISVISYQSETIGEIMSSKVDELNPVINSEEPDTDIIISVNNDIVSKKLAFNYDFEFKSFDLIAALMGEDDFGIKGGGSGFVNNDSSNFSVNMDLEFDHFYTLRNNEILYLSNLESNINFSRDNRINAFDNLFGALSISSDRIIAGSKVKNFNADFIFNDSRLFYNVDTEIDTFLTSSFDGSILLSPGMQRVIINSALLNYKDVQWKNKQQALIDFSPDSLEFVDFKLYNDSTTISITGLFTSIGENDLNFSIDNIPGDLLSYYLFDDKNRGIESTGNITSSLTGTIQDPKLVFDFTVSEIKLNNTVLGNFLLSGSYFRDNLDLSIKFIERKSDINEPQFLVTGNFPVTLFPDEGNSFIDSSRSLTVLLQADEFDIASFGSLIPMISKQQGYLNGNVNLNGTIDDLNYDGSLSLSKTKFLSLLNNLEYKVAASLTFNGKDITVDSVKIANLIGSRLNGELVGNGKIKLDGFLLNEIDMNVSGGLGVLGNRSKSVSPAIYGNLFVQAKDKWNFTYKQNKSKFTGTFLLREADLTFSPLQNSYTSSDIIYTFKIDSSKLDKEEIKFAKLVNSKSSVKGNKSLQKFFNFDYSINVEIENEAKIEFILSPSFNQKLIVLADGNMRYESLGEDLRAQGQFNLLEGSKLEFFKVLDAEGYIRFETSISDPFLNIIATYTTDYYTTVDSPPTPVAVKMKINGSFSELGKNLTASKDNILVYVGSKNISDNIPDYRYSEVDALSFILIGSPANDLSKDKGAFSGFAQELSDSFLGSALTSLVNSRVGDAINDIKLSTTGQETRLSVSGKIENVRYSVSSALNDKDQNTNLFKNINKANIRIEYLFSPKFLIRMERKNSITDFSGTEDNIYELGLKYLIVF
ncbi:MAG: hypothetical protein JW995_06695 [Melioribacteraceae bacterium]|nr:hypothetical protein [Melioribacteraceae bacterium]